MSKITTAVEDIKKLLSGKHERNLNWWADSKKIVFWLQDNDIKIEITLQPNQDPEDKCREILNLLKQKP